MEWKGSKRKSMKKKINHRFMLISALAIIVIAVCSMVLFYDILKKQIFDDLKANAHVISLMQRRSCRQN